MLDFKKMLMNESKAKYDTTSLHWDNRVGQAVHPSNVGCVNKVIAPYFAKTSTSITSILYQKVGQVIERVFLNEVNRVLGDLGDKANKYASSLTFSKDHYTMVQQYILRDLFVNGRIDAVLFKGETPVVGIEVKSCSPNFLSTAKEIHPKHIHQVALYSTILEHPVVVVYISRNIATFSGKNEVNLAIKQFSFNAKDKENYNVVRNAWSQVFQIHRFGEEDRLHNDTAQYYRNECMFCDVRCDNLPFMEKSKSDKIVLQSESQAEIYLEREYSICA